MVTNKKYAIKNGPVLESIIVPDYMCYDTATSLQRVVTYESRIEDNREIKKNYVIIA